MAHDVQRPHDKLFRTVFADHGEAAALLRAHLPESLARDLRWSTLTLQDRSFVDPDLRDTESDLLFSISGGCPPVRHARRLDVGLSGARGEEVGPLHRGNLLRDRRRHELIDAGAVFLADLGDSRLQGRRKTQRIHAGLSLHSSILLNACWGDSTAIPNRPGGAGRVPDDAGRLARLTARRDPASRRQ
jgi:hypothetical protein